MNEIFAAVYQRLTSQLSIGVYDHVPQDLPNASYPYVRIDAPALSNGDTDTENGFFAEMQVIGFSQYEGVKEANDITGSVYGALHHWAFPDTATYGISTISETFRQIKTNPDGLTRSSVQRYQIIFEPLPTI